MAGSNTESAPTTEYERMPRPPEGFAACRVGSGPQVTHLVILDSEGGNGGRPTLCRLTRFPTRGNDGEVLLDADLRGWSMGGGVEGPRVRQIKCDDCYDRLDRVAALHALPPASTSGEGLTGTIREAGAHPVDWKTLYEQTSLRIHRMSRESARVRMPAEVRDLLAVPPATS